MSTDQPNSIRLFGTDHSPWTQAVVLSAVAHGIKVRLQPYPPSVWSFWQRGLVMPACGWSNGESTSDSLAIMVRLLGTGKRAPDVDLQQDQAALEKLFFCYVLDRAGPGRWWAFVQLWSRKMDSPHTVLSVTIRALLAWYFVMMLGLGRLQMRLAGVSTRAPERLKRRLGAWESRLKDAPFLGGEHPNPTDFGLLGQLECMASGPTDWTLEIVAEHPLLMTWLERMHVLVEEHGTVHSRRFFDSTFVPVRATDFESSWFSLCFVLWLLLF